MHDRSSRIRQIVPRELLWSASIMYWLRTHGEILCRINRAPVCLRRAKLISIELFKHIFIGSFIIEVPMDSDVPQLPKNLAEMDHDEFIYDISWSLVSSSCRKKFSNEGYLIFLSKLAAMLLKSPQKWS